MRCLDRTGTMSWKPLVIFGGLILASLALWTGPRPLQGAEISWGLPFTVDDDMDIILPTGATVHFAADFNTAADFGPEGGVINGITFTQVGPAGISGLLSHSFSSGPNNGAAAYAATAPAGMDLDLVELLDSHSWHAGNPQTASVTLQGLTVGASYQIQVIGPVDLRAGSAARTYEPDDGLGNFDTGTSIERGLVQSILGTFTADGASQQFQWRSLNNAAGHQDPGMSGLLVTRLPGAPTGVVTATLNRDTGNLSIHNGTTTPFEILGYSVLSGFGGLNPQSWLSVANNYDKPSNPTPGNGSIDNDDAWTVLSSSSDRTQLSEAELNVAGPRNGGAIGPGQTFNLGNVWIKSSTEDVMIQVLRPDGQIHNLGLSYAGNGGQPFPFGDLNFDNQLTPADWTIFMSNALTNLAGLSPAQRYQKGDFDGDGVNNLNDMRLFLQAYDAANGAGSSAQLLAGTSVPEPSACLLLLMGSAAVMCRRFTRRLPFRCAGVPLATCLLLAIGGAVFNSPQASAQVVLNPIPTSGYDQDIIVELGAAVGTQVTSGELGSRQFYEDGLQASQPTNPKEGLTPIVSSTLASGNTINFGFQPFTENNIVKFDATNPGPKTVSLLAPSAFGTLAIAFSGGSLSTTIADLNYTINFAGGQTQTGTVGVPDWGNVALPEGTEMLLNAGRINMGGGTWNNQIPEGDTTPNRWSIYVSEIAIDNPTEKINSIDFSATLTGSQDITVFGLAGPDPGVALTLDLEVNKSTGSISIKNPSFQDVDVKGYELLSASGSLSTVGWSVPSGWLKAGGASSSALVAGALLDSDSVHLPAENAGAPLSLGTAYNTSVGAEDLVFRFLTSDEAIRTGTVSYVTGAGLQGDYNGDGKVDAADYVVWRKTGINGQQGYNTWRANFGQMAGSGAAAAQSGAVPEPSGLLLLLTAFTATLVAGQRHRLVTVAGFARIQLDSPKFCNFSFGAMAVLASLIAAGSSVAAAFPDRVYSFGDDPGEDAAGAPGGVVGTGPNNIATPIIGCCYTLDTFGPVSGSRPPLQALGSPLYINVTTTSANLAQTRPGATPGSLGIRFDGADDHLLGAALNYPHTSISASGFDPPGPLDYVGITDRGFQLWVYPDAAKQGQAQEVVNDGTQHGLWINAAGNWVMRYNNASTTSNKAVAFNQWQHVMVVRPTPTSGSILYVNGEAVAAAAGAYSLTDTNLLILGANTGATPGTSNFFQGVLDDMNMFIMGQVQNGPNPLAGTYKFELGSDNDWMANSALSGLSGVVGDVNQDGLVGQADINALVAGWGKEKRVNNIRVGDKLTILDGDLNYDGITNLSDVFILHQALLASGSGAGFDFSLIPGWNSVPEPSTLTLAAMVLSLCSTIRVGRIGRRKLR